MKFASENGEIMLYRYISFERMNNMPHNGNRFQITWCPKNRKRRRQCDDKRIDIEVKSGEKKIENSAENVQTANDYGFTVIYASK